MDWIAASWAWFGANIEAVGSTCLGFVLGAIAGCFFGEAKKLTWHILVATVGILAGAGVVALFQMLSTYAAPGRAIWFYPVGLLPGFLFGVYLLAYPPEE